ncbi:hypothetical protein SG34_023450 [Thalassomonas viridans]|uniref:Uncharacterized protein n=1 Tax=Thalassomonas viridans TaxID=137584 RepID=A0AAE9Z134_9GAMM|nr:hypothetical protein [Thalassomonas viridans]WDE04267.1 hypothetical protein SG34_023450 [Thalassomonas viridans]
MKPFNIKMPVILSCALTLGLAQVASGNSLAGQEKDSSDGYSIHFIKDCRLVKKLPMTPGLITLHQQLQQQEAKMAALQAPVEAISAKIDHYSQQINRLTELAVQEDNNSLKIDKTYLAQQQVVTDKLNRLLAGHQRDFAALEQQGHQIEQVAHDFEAEIRGISRDLDFDHVRILSPGDSRAVIGCEQNIDIL